VFTYTSVLNSPQLSFSSVVLPLCTLTRAAPACYSNGENESLTADWHSLVFRAVYTCSGGERT